MGFFDIFNKTNRKIIPLSLYLGYEQDGEDAEKNGKDMTFANPNDFPEELFDKIIIMIKRLHEMGVYEEKEIVRFIIPKTLEYLELGGILSGVSILSFDTVGIVFGENYAGWIYKGETKKHNEIFYSVPYQLVFYHSKKENNYFICKTKNGLELRQNKVSVTNSEDKERIIKNTKSIDLTENMMNELKAAYSVLFMYIKMQILRNMDKLGYLAFIEKTAEHFCFLQEKAKFISYAKQYFALSVNKEENELAYEKNSFKDFLSKLLLRKHYSVDLSVSYADIIKWVEERIRGKIHIQRECCDHIEFIKELSDTLVTKGYYLYFLIKEELFHTTELLLGKEKYISENNSNFSHEIIGISEALTKRYIEDISRERRIREVAKSFYQTIGVKNIRTMMMNITGGRVLDYELMKKHYLSAIYAEDDMDIRGILGDLLAMYHMPDLIKNGSKLTLDNLYFLELESVNPVDRAILYADLIRQKEKLLYSFEVGDYFYLGIIEDNIETKDSFISCANIFLEMKEIESYVIYDSEDKEMFVNLLCGIGLTMDGEHFYTSKEIREKFYKENVENISRNEADEYLSRIVLKKSEVKICVSNYYKDEEELEFIIKAENRKHFTNLDLIFQIQTYLAKKIDFSKMFSNRISISGLRLSIDRDKYYLFWDE